MTCFQLAWVIINKLADHLPLYRIEQIAARQQVVLSRATMADWVGKMGVALQPLADRLAWHLLQGSTKKTYLWAYRSNDLEPGSRIIVFDFCAGRGGVNCRNFLGAWLRDTLEKLPTWPNRRIDELLPFVPKVIEKLKHG